MPRALRGDGHGGHNVPGLDERRVLEGGRRADCHAPLQRLGGDGRVANAAGCRALAPTAAWD